MRVYLDAAPVIYLVQRMYPYFKTADAIHLAAAVQARCDVFLTNDYRLGRFKEIEVRAVEAASEQS